MELKRVIFNRKTLFLFLFILSIGVGLFINSQMKNEEYSGYSISEINKVRGQFVEEFKNCPPEKLAETVTYKLTCVTTLCDLMNFDKMKSDNYKEYEELLLESEQQLRSENKETAKYYDNNKKNIDANSLYVQQKVLTEISEQVEHINSYPDYLESINGSAEDMSGISIFKTDNNSVNGNIDKTVQDYSKLKNIELTLGIDEPIVSVANSQLSNYLLILFSVFIILIFLEERKQGLWTLIYSSPKGRFNLALKRAGVLSLITVLATVVMYICVFATAFGIYGGTADLSRNVQSIAMFKNFVFPMSELQFILFYIGVNVLMQMALAFILWAIFSFIQNVSFAFGVTGIVFAEEILLYNYLPYQNYFSLFKCINIFTFINPSSAIIKYKNLETFGFTENMLSLLIIGAVVCIVIFSSLAVIFSTFKRPNKTPTKIEVKISKLITRIKNIYWLIIERLTVTGYELYKILVIQKGFIAIIIFLFILFGSVNTDTIYYSATDSVVNSFYGEHSGNDINNTEVYGKNLAKEIQGVDREYEKAVSDYKDKKITEEEYLNKEMKSLAYDSKREALEIIEERISYAKDNNVWLVNPQGYNQLLGKECYTQQTKNGILSIFLLIILLSGVFAYEKKSNVHYTLKATYRGRNYIFRKKILVSSIIAVVLWIVTGVTDFYRVLVNNNLENFTAPIKSLMFFKDLPFEVSIITYLILVYLIKLVMILCVAYIICYISSVTRYEVCIAVSTLVLVVPSILCILGIEVFKYLSLALPVSALKLLGESTNFVFVIPIVLVVVLGISGLVLSNKRWCKNEA